MSNQPQPSIQPDRSQRAHLIGTPADDAPLTISSSRLRERLEAALAPEFSRRLWRYEEAFRRHTGLIDRDEQQKLRSSHVAVAGLGGAGGIDLVTLARLGIGRFSIADATLYDHSDGNLQYGATASIVGRGKAQVMAGVAEDINPEIELRRIKDPLGPENVEQLLDGADLVVDALGPFDFDARRLLLRSAAVHNIPTIIASTFGFSAVWLVFDPCGMSFDQYFDVSDAMTPTHKLAALFAGLAPATDHRSYLDLHVVDPIRRIGPSAAPAGNMAAAAVGCEAVKILLDRGQVRAVPWYQQLDLMTGRFVQKRLRRGNRSPRQRIKRIALERQIRKLSAAAMSA